MMPEVRADPFRPTSNLIPCRFHQGYTPARTFHINFDKVARAQVSGRVSPSCRSAGERSITAMVSPAHVAINSFALFSISFSPGYDISNQTAYLDDMLRWSLGWLMKVGSWFL